MPETLLLAAGHNGLRAISRDGKNWLPPTLGKEGEVCRGAAVGNGRLVTVGTLGGKQILAHSADGTKWEQATRDGGYGGYLRSLAFVNNQFVALGGDPGAVGHAKPYVMTSTDGQKWSEPHQIGGKFMLRRLAFGEGTYVGVGDRGRRARSTDLRKWEDAPDVKPIETLIDVAYGNGRFVGVGLHSLRMVSSDGLKWTDKLIGEEGEHLNAIVWSGKQFVAVGAGVTYTSPDGLKWERRPNELAPLTTAFGHGHFLGPRWKGRLLLSRDGVSWTETHRFEHHIESVAVGQI